MNAAELCGSLGVGSAELDRWLADGLPYRESGVDRSFDPAAVSEWLIARGFAEDDREPDDVVFATQRDAANWYGVSHDTLARGWRARGMPGDIGHYSAREISRWLAQRYAQGSGAESDTLNRRRIAESRKIEADAELRELKLQNEQGNMVPLAEVRLQVAEALIQIRDNLLRIPSLLLPQLPREHAHEVSDTVRRQIELSLKQLVQNFRRVTEQPTTEPAADV